MKYTRYPWGIRKTSPNVIDYDSPTSDCLTDLIDAYIIVDKVTGFRTVTMHIDTHIINSDYEVYGAMFHENNDGSPSLVSEVIFTRRKPKGELLYGRE